MIRKRIINLESFHYSAIIAMQPNTHLLIGTDRARVDIPVGSMIVFRGGISHAGGEHQTPNAIILIVHHTYPLSTAIYLIKYVVNAFLFTT
jgi:hypothetical protein